MTRLSASIVSFLFVMMFCGVVYSAKAQQKNAGDWVGLVRIDSSSHLDKNERPAVYFPHDIHTDSLSDQSTGCAVCHDEKNPKAPYAFINPAYSQYDDIMNGYHDRCIGCHTEYIAAGKQGGPVICSSCHKEDQTFETANVSARFDKSLHQRHTQALNKSCKDCHHIYDETLQKTVYVKGKEGSCVYCHPQVPAQKEMGLQVASHSQCVQCHEKRIKSKKTAGPIRCEGCHDSDKRKAYKKAPAIDRLDMGQKDLMMLNLPGKTDKDGPMNRMAFVPFDHMNHEKGIEACYTCHHKSLSACSSCHTMTGSEKSQGVSLETAMHDTKSQRSCTGCHENHQKAKECAGCHGFDINRTTDDQRCKRCHVSSVLSTEPAKQAQGILASSKAKSELPDLANVPEKLMINTLENKYQGVDFPHRKIVKELYRLSNNNPMARYFHQGTNTLCLGCHHNSPPTDKPAACGTCHTAEKTRSQINKPGLLGAYHIQCMECHARMNIRQPESCTQCHKEKH